MVAISTNGVPAVPRLRFLAAANSRRSSRSSDVAFSSRRTAFALRICFLISEPETVFPAAEFDFRVAL